MKWEQSIQKDSAFEAGSSFFLVLGLELREYICWTNNLPTELHTQTLKIFIIIILKQDFITLPWLRLNL